MTRAEKIITMENEHLLFELDADGAARILHKASGTRWEMGRVAVQEDGLENDEHVWYRTERMETVQYPGRFKARDEGDGVFRYELMDREGATRGVFRCRIRLDGEWLDMELLDIDASLPTLTFPPPIVSDSLVLPIAEGAWLRKPLERRKFYPVYSANSMRWIGGLKHDACGDDANRGNQPGWIAIFAEGEADAGYMVARKTVSPVWRKTLGKWGGPKRLRYTFTSSGGYVALAKIFRQWVMEKRIFTSLRHKASKCPALNNLAGAREVYLMTATPRMDRVELENDMIPPDSYPQNRFDGVSRCLTFKEALEMVQRLRASGPKNGFVTIGGWLNNGYDGRYPDVWPPEPACGTPDEFAALLAAGGDDYTIGFHDNYQDIYPNAPSFPRGCLVQKNGRLMQGGYWGWARCYILNTRDSLAYQKRNWQHLGAMAPRFVYADTIGASQLMESYEPGNTLTRAQDKACKEALLQFYTERGIVAATENGQDYCATHASWFAANRQHTPGETIPLWDLVFHDAALSGDGIPLDAGPKNGKNDPSLLKLMIWGHMLHYFYIGGWEHFDLYNRHRESTMFVDEWHRKTAFDEMTSHRYLTPDGLVEESVFASGRAVVVNFGPEDATVGGKTIPGHGFVADMA